MEKLDPVAVATWVLCIVGLAQVIIFRRQATLMDRTLRSTEKSALDALKATEKLADSMAASVRVSMGVTLPRLLLYDFKPEPAGLANIRAQIQSPHVKLKVKNYGKSPAFIEFVSLEMTCTAALLAKPDYIHGHNPDKETVVQENDVREIADARYLLLTDPEIAAVFDKTKTIYIYGIVQYRDIWNQRHVLRFCKDVFVNQYSFTTSLVDSSVPSSYTDSSD